ncbi:MULTISPECIES: hypothetical protein [Haloferax]|uniref:DUF304 domain-containing protein n=1 Tax=Haloferax marinum TaxID=2666143 RepID=A0A6A8G5W6_9EURY|nr:MULTISPECIES: hypothetical protein [Haloferax]KAB1196943.1 hypothetical protein Hfx1150_05165 [Haloferax sp. CBA1150]MRW95962.1 hypothetical protein [Haloferax marinum]
MSTADIVALVIVLVGLGVVLIPFLYGAVYVAGRLGVGPLSNEGLDRSDSETAGLTVDLRGDEEAVYVSSPDRERWRPLFVVGLFLIPFFWGVPLCFYAYRLRNQPKYVVTSDRVIEKIGSDTSSYPLADIAQLQTGANLSERLTNKGHVKFSVDHSQLVTISGLRRPGRVARLIDA